jgi:hypothetical protein
MTVSTKIGPAPIVSAQAEQEMAQHGITRVPHDYFYYGEFRYTNLNDAIEQAKRQERRRTPDVR